MTGTFDHDRVLATLRRCWSAATGGQWQAANPARGQCNVTALLVADIFGGDILKTPLPAGDHFYNRIEGRRVDLTDSQFDSPIAYLDLPTDRHEALAGTTAARYAALSVAYREHAAGRAEDGPA